MPGTTTTTTKFASIRDVQRTYGLSRAGVYRLLGNRRLRAVKSGRTTLVDVASVDAYFASLPAATIRPPAAA